MSRARRVSSSLALAATLMLAGPAAAIASSAGDQQYTDPLASGHGGSSQSSSGSHSSSPASSGASSLSGSAGSGSSSGTTLASGTSSTSGASGTTGTSSSTSSAGSTRTTAAGSALPYTGYNSDLSAALGLGLVLSGVALRRAARLRRSSDA